MDRRATLDCLVNLVFQVNQEKREAVAFQVHQEFQESREHQDNQEHQDFQGFLAPREIVVTLDPLACLASPDKRVAQDFQVLLVSQEQKDSPDFQDPMVFQVPQVFQDSRVTQVFQAYQADQVMWQ